MRIFGGIVVSDAHSHSEEVVAMEVKGMRLNGEEIGDLEHQLSRGVEGNFYQTCARRGAKVRTQRCTCVVERCQGSPIGIPPSC